MPNDHIAEMAETLRRAHCSREEKDHPCVGTCTITSTGVELACRLCGNSTEPRVYLRREHASFARRLVTATGLDWDALTPERQLRVVETIRETSCPGCGIRLLAMLGFYSCGACKQWEWSETRGWSKHDAP